MDALKVLIVDDIPLNRRLVEAAIKDLCDEGVLVADRATKAIEIALAEGPDLVFMDIGLPDIDGLEAVAMMKRDPRLSRIPVVIVSAHAHPEFEERARSLGCASYITKPIAIRAVRDTVERHRPQTGVATKRTPFAGLHA